MAQLESFYSEGNTSESERFVLAMSFSREQERMQQAQVLSELDAWRLGEILALYQAQIVELALDGEQVTALKRITRTIAECCLGEMYEELAKDFKEQMPLEGCKEVALLGFESFEESQVRNADFEQWVDRLELGTMTAAKASLALLCLLYANLDFTDVAAQFTLQPGQPIASGMVYVLSLVLALENIDKAHRYRLLCWAACEAIRVAELDSVLQQLRLVRASSARLIDGMDFKELSFYH